MNLLLIALGFLLLAHQGFGGDRTFALKSFSSPNHSVGSATAYDILEDTRGLIYVATSKELLEYDGIQWRSIELNSTQGVSTLGSDHNGRVYVAGHINIGYLSPDLLGKMKFVSLLDKIPPGEHAAITKIVAIAAFGEKVAFITEQAIFIWDGHTFEILRLDEKIYSGFGYQDQLDLSAEDRGLLMLTEKNFENVPGGQNFTASTFNLGPQILAGTIGKGINLVTIGTDGIKVTALPNQDLALYGGNQISSVTTIPPVAYAGTIGGGLKIFDSSTGELIALDSKHKEQIGKDIYAVRLDQRARIWIGSSNGVFVLMNQGEELEPESSGGDASFRAYIRSCLSLKDQTTIFGGAFFKEVGGVQTLEASELNKPNLSFDQNSLRFNYSSSDLVNADLIEYQTFLVGFDKEWSDWSQRTYREFTNLVWHNYRFRVRARRTDSKVSEEASFEFTILPPWYEQYWFYLLQLVILAIVFIIVVYINGWTDPSRSKDRSKKLNNIIIGTIWGYSFSKIGVQGALWAFSGGAAFLAVISKVVMGIFLKPMQKKVELKIVDLQKSAVKRLQEKTYKKNKSIDRLRDLIHHKFRPGQTKRLSPRRRKSPSCTVASNGAIINRRSP